MRGAFIDYLEKIGMTEVFRQRAERVYQIAESLDLGEIQDIFVTDYADTLGKRHYGNVIFFTNKYWIGSLDFLNKDNIDSVHIDKQILFWKIESEAYDFQNSTEKSRMIVKVFYHASSITTEFKASGKNCDYLWNIFKKYVVSNMAGSPERAK